MPDKNRLEPLQADPPFAGHQVFFIRLWWMCFFFYPLWYLPASNSIRIQTAVILFGILILCTLLFRFIAHTPFSSATHPKGGIPDKRFFFLLFGSVLLLHLPFLNQPILTGLDTIDHAAIPAEIAHTLTQPLTDALGFPFSFLLTGLLILLFIAVLVFPSFRLFIGQVYNRSSRIISTHLVVSFLILAAITTGYVAFLLHFRFLERFDDLNPLFRYPPLSKLISIPLYVCLGIHEWIGRVVQLAFTFAGGYYLYRITSLFSTRLAARISALLYVLLPPIFHYGNTTMIEGGTLFFITAAFFYWMRYLETHTQSDLVWGTLWATLACLYKHPAVSLIPAFTGMVLYDFLIAKHPRTLRQHMATGCSIAIPAITIIVFMKLSGFNSDVPSALQVPSFSILAGNLAAIPKGVTFPIALLLLAGFVALPFLKDKRVFCLMICWVGSHYLLTCMSKAALNVRQALPYYVGLLVPAAILLERLTADRKGFRILLVYVALPIYLVWACLFMDRNQDVQSIGRAMGDRSYVNFSNWNTMYLPYPQLIQTLNQITAPGDVIYAPMTNEPVHFYLAKYDMRNRDYRREIWEPNQEKQSLSSLVEYCQSIQAGWLVVPKGRWLYADANLSWVEELFRQPPPGLIPVQEIQAGSETIGIWKVDRKPE